MNELVNQCVIVGMKQSKNYLPYFTQLLLKGKCTGNESRQHSQSNILGEPVCPSTDPQSVDCWKDIIEKETEDV